LNRFLARQEELSFVGYEVNGDVRRSRLSKSKARQGK
jgi:hypothetical protein